MYNEHWQKKFPHKPPDRALRWLMCGKKTDMHDREDVMSEQPYDWDSLTWEDMQLGQWRLNIEDILGPAKTRMPEMIRQSMNQPRHVLMSMAMST